MTDTLVKRLRGHIQRNDLPCLGCSLSREAADRIDELQARCDELSGLVQRSDREIDEMAATIAKLLFEKQHGEWNSIGE